MRRTLSSVLPTFKNKIASSAKILLVLYFVLFAWLHLAAPINLATADLGRHIRNGEAFFQEHKALDTNYYSSTHREFPAVCHHWGTGVLFYGIWRFFDFRGLSIFYGLILLASLGLFMWTAARSSSLAPSLGGGLLMLPLVGYRIEIRPEGISSLFLAVLFALLTEHRAGRLKNRWLWLIPAIQWIWVNMHLFYGIGLCLIGIFLLDAWVNQRARGQTKTLALILGVSAILSLGTPFGLSGILQPGLMFRTYRYMLAENQTVFFMLSRFPGAFIYPYFLGMMTLLGLGMGLRIFGEKSWRKSFLPVILCIFFGALAIRAVRGIAVFGLFWIPLAAECLQGWIRRRGESRFTGWQKNVGYGAVLLLLAASSLVPSLILSPIHKYAPWLRQESSGWPLMRVLLRPSWWSGLMPGVNQSAEFFKENRLRGPVFNNYDLGGYFIFHFFPKERPFVDNRPEAYPAEFFETVYNPMQEKEAVWHEMDRRFNFQIIYFYRHDQTTWAQPFLIRRISDPAWAPIFVDGYTIILAKRGGVNQSVISRFEIPREMFRSIPNE